MAVNPGSWGVLGNPSKEKIAEYAKMPVGSFRNMVKNVSRGKRGKKMSEHTIYVTRRDINATRGVITVTAFDFADAVGMARTRQEEVVWDAEPYKTDYQEYTYSSMDPLVYRR